MSKANLPENTVHRFNIIDSQILLGLSYADKGADISCLDLISSCAAINHSIPARPEFAEAFNKFLYMSAINLDNDQLSLANFGREIINNASSRANTTPQPVELMQLVLKELSGYKLKSMCNRSLWTQEQYQRALDAHRNNSRL
jgi:hypothetical protein